MWVLGGCEWDVHGLCGCCINIYTYAELIVHTKLLHRWHRRSEFCLVKCTLFACRVYLSISTYAGCLDLHWRSVLCQLHWVRCFNPDSIHNQPG